MLILTLVSNNARGKILYHLSLLIPSPSIPYSIIFLAYCLACVTSTMVPMFQQTIFVCHKGATIGLISH